MTEGEKFARSMYGVVLAFKNTLTLPTDKSLFDTFKYSAALTVISLLSNLIGFYTFLTWQGCGLCTMVLVLLLYIERSENDALLRMYRNAELLAKEGVRRAKEASSGVRVQRSTRSGDTGKQETSGRPKSNGSRSSARHTKRSNSGGRRKGNGKSY